MKKVFGTPHSGVEPIGNQKRRCASEGDRGTAQGGDLWRRRDTTLSQGMAGQLASRVDLNDPFR